MSSIEILSLIVTIVALVSLSFVFTFLFRNYFRGIIEAVQSGEEDAELIYEEAMGKREKTVAQKILHYSGKALSYLILLLLVGVFTGSLVSRFMGTEMSIGGNIPLVIVSGSMSYKNDANQYLYANHLDDQFQTYDIIVVNPTASPDDIELYDVIAFYSSEGTVVVHRVVEIVDTSEGPMYVTRGDANDASDNNALYGDYLPYQQIVGEYHGVRVPAVGAFVLFLQSGAGVVCVISIVYCFAIFEFYRRKMDLAIEERTEKLLSFLTIDEADANADVNFTEVLTYKGKDYALPNGEPPTSKEPEAALSADKGDETSSQATSKEDQQ